MTEQARQFTFTLHFPSRLSPLSEILVMNLAQWEFNDAHAALIFTICMLAGGDLNRRVHADTVAREFQKVLAANPDITHINHVATVQITGKETGQ